ncbi:MAG: peptidoglycan DD-metalloendopeptidase family protein [Gammaproteobacteria bacterium]|nr:peptidoglycan DD-metalloendopeptidase family protein [Gammaproteobacteria bacterium]
MRHDDARQLISLSVGKELIFKSDQQQLKQIHYPRTKLQQLEVHFMANEITQAGLVDRAFAVEQQVVSGEITSSLYEAALEYGLSISMVMEMVRIFGWDIDFAQDIRRGDSFHVIYNDYILDDGDRVDGDIIAAEFTSRGRTYRAIRFADQKGNVSFYTPEGDSMLGTFLRTPVEFSRISSRFGRRKHPISKRWKAHKGVDYAAGRGTPVRATADGKVILAGRNGGYGKTVVLRHAGRFSTLYAHMNGYAKGIRSGARVKQGQTIGYVGSTGYSTGPHLHYEFRVDGVHRNPLTYKTPKASSVTPELRTEFNEVAQAWSTQLDVINRNYQLAKNNARTSAAGSQAM